MENNDKNKRKKSFKFSKKKVCYFCINNIDEIDYKNTEVLSRFITERYKIVSRKASGVCAKHQRKLSTSIKRARIMALLPFTINTKLKSW